MSQLTAAQVCLASNTTKGAKVISHLIETAMECWRLGNWNSAMAIALGLNLTPVNRLNKTWSKVKSTKLVLLKVQYSLVKYSLIVVLFSKSVIRPKISKITDLE